MNDSQRVAVLEVNMAVLLRALHFPEHMKVVGVHLEPERAGPIVLLKIEDEKFAPVAEGCVMPRVHAVISNHLGFVRWGS